MHCLGKGDKTLTTECVKVHWDMLQILICSIKILQRKDLHIPIQIHETPFCLIQLKNKFYFQQVFTFFGIKAP